MTAVRPRLTKLTGCRHKGWLIRVHDQNTDRHKFHWNSKVTEGSGSRLAQLLGFPEPQLQSLSNLLAVATVGHLRPHADISARTPVDQIDAVTTVKQQPINCKSPLILLRSAVAASTAARFAFSLNVVWCSVRPSRPICPCYDSISTCR